MGAAGRGTLGIHASSRVLRVPMGWVWMAAALVVVALIVSFSLGHRSGAARAERERADQFDQLGQLDQFGQPDQAAQLAGGPAGRAGDPLVAPSGAEEPGRSPAAGAARSAESGPGGARQSPPRTAGDPRVSGHSYFVVAHPLPERADELVAFLRSEGLDGAVIRERSSRFPKVIALPGFEDPKSSAASDFRSKLRAAGLRWKAKARGNQDFGNAYLERHGS